MKIAIASLNKEENSEIASVAGRAPYFLIYEGEKLLEVIKNPFAVGGGGVGDSVAKMLKDKKVNKIIAEQFGEKMLDALKERGIEYQEVSNKKIKEVLKQ